MCTLMEPNVNSGGYRRRFEAMVTELRAHPYIDVIDVNFGEPASVQELDEARRVAGGHLPAGVAEFYAEMNGFLLEWELTHEDLRRGDDSDRGAVDILTAAETWKDWDGLTWKVDDYDGWGIRPLDFFAPEACAAFTQSTSGTVGLTVQYYTLGERLLDTGCGFKDFVDRLLVSRGAFYWIESLCLGADVSAAARDFHWRLSILFPDFPHSMFAPLV
jgi:hypothetical protein